MASQKPVDAEIAPKKMPHYAGLDGWRGISILCVLAAHMLPLGPKSWELNQMFAPLGMSLFFTLSGFLITSTLIYHPNVLNFLIRRSCRILPLAWTYLLVALPLVSATFDTYLAHFLFFANIPPFWLTQLTEHFWSLCVEIYFYLFIAAIFALLNRRGLLILPFLCLIITGVRIYNNQPISIITYYRVDEILVGAWLALIYKGYLGSILVHFLRWVNPLFLLGILLIACHPASGFMNYIRPYLAASLVGSTLYQAQSSLSRLLKTRMLSYLAQVSYALYIIHPLTYYSWLGSGDTVIKYMKRPLSFFLTFMLAHISTFYYEKHWIDWGKNKTTKISP
jgi:peptidoglycan/LPS O-acetylase OafA/YrhL